MHVYMAPYNDSWGGPTGWRLAEAFEHSEGRRNRTTAKVFNWFVSSKTASFDLAAILEDNHKTNPPPQITEQGWLTLPLTTGKGDGGLMVGEGGLLIGLQLSAGLPPSHRGWDTFSRASGI